MVAVILVISVLLQLTAAGAALRLIPVTGKRLGWVAIAAAILLMAVRRIITLVHLLTSSGGAQADLATELVALAISALMVIGLLWIAPLFVSIRDTDRSLRTANRALRTLSECNQVLVRTQDETRLMEEVCRIMVGPGGYRLAWVGFAEHDKARSVRPVAQSGFEEGYLETAGITWADTERGRGPTGRAIRTCEPVVARNILTDPEFEPWREAAIKRGYASSVALPLCRNKGVLGALNIYAAEADAFDREEVTLLTELANDLAYGLTSLRTRQERNHAEDARRVSEQRFRTLFDTMREGFVLHEAVRRQEGRPLDYRFLEVNPSFCSMIGMPSEEVVGKTIDEVVPDLEGPWFHTYQEVAAKGEPSSFEGFSETLGRYFSADVFSPREGQFAAVFVDTTERTRSEERIQRQLNRLDALREIDLAITASLDPRVTFQVLLSQVTEQLNVDAADILILDKHSQTLDFVTGKGFHTPALQHTHLRLGEGNAGKAARTREFISISDLSETKNGLSHSPHLPEEGFVSYFAMPLTAKGTVQGVLEIFHRQPFEPDEEWLDFLEALAGQAAIAIDNSILFDELNRSNSDLLQAYDKTLEGWARALELRDIETEGHSQRVAELAVRLARHVGMTGPELVHVRRGALLHDIGKMGIPDAILHKPGKLDEAEWEIMRKHPSYAYEMLYPIGYLRPCLDIPHCHHEKWDGSGYPRALKGEEIPLSARVFAVVDVWDALHSDRPYRAAWSDEESVEYLHQQKGQHFDPSLIDAFLGLLGRT